jgi:hypothetical protein
MMQHSVTSPKARCPKENQHANVHYYTEPTLRKENRHPTRLARRRLGALPVVENTGQYDGTPLRLPQKAFRTSHPAAMLEEGDLSQ